MKSKMIQLGSDSGDYVSARHVQAITIVSHDTAGSGHLLIVHVNDKTAKLTLYFPELVHAKKASASLARLIDAACE